MTATLLTNFMLLDPRDGSYRPGYKVLVRDKTVEAVTEGPVEAPDAVTVDLGGRTLMPGLIDCHLHIISVHLKNANDTLRHMQPSLMNAYAAIKLKRILMRGFTSARDLCGADRGHREALELGLLTGPRLSVCGRALSQTGGHSDRRTRVDYADPMGFDHIATAYGGGSGRIADGVDEVRRAARDEIRLGVDFLKVMASGGVGSISDPIHFLQYSMEELRALVDEAERADTYVAAHTYTAAAIKRVVEAGIRTIEHGNLIDTEAADMIAARGFFLVPTLVTYGNLVKYGKELGYPDYSIEKSKRVLEAGNRSLEIAQKAGVKMAYGTDLMGEQMEYQSDEFAIRAQVLPTLEVIRHATIRGAEVIRMEGKVGVIAPGAFADMIAVNGNPLDDISVLTGQGENIPAIMKDGAWVKNELGESNWRM